MADLLDEFQTYLVAQGLARKPDVVAAGKHPLWIERKLGVPAPGDMSAPQRDDVLVMGAYRTGGLASAAYESMYRSDIVDLQVRSTHSFDAWALDAQLRAALVDKRQWMMGAFPVLESLEWRAMQRVRSDDQGYVHTVAYIFYHVDAP